MKNNPSPITDAIRVVGNASRLAEKMGISHVAVAKWVKRGKPPAARCLSIEKITGVSRHDLRPDIYGEKKDVA